MSPDVPDISMNAYVQNNNNYNVTSSKMNSDDSKEDLINIENSN